MFRILTLGVRCQYFPSFWRPHATHADHFHTNVDFGNKLNLTTLFLQVEFCWKTARCLTCLLSNFATPSLQKVSLRFRFPWYELDVDKFWSDWKGIDRALDSQRLPCLRSVKVIPIAPMCWILDMERFHEKFAEQFPSLVSKGILEFADDDVDDPTTRFGGFIDA
jgi:hypothetical protein